MENNKQLINSYLECDLVALGERILADELHNLVEVLLLLQNLTNLLERQINERRRTTINMRKNSTEQGTE